jgi:pimeloyl-ACP methyl ester carboxylesterase
LFGFILVAILATGCSTPKAAAPETVAIAVGGRPDKMTVHLSFKAGSTVQWSNEGTEPIEIVFLHGGPAPLQVAAGAKSRLVAVSEFGAQGSFPYHVSRPGSAANQAGQTAAVSDTTGGPGDPDVDAGP